MQVQPPPSYRHSPPPPLPSSSSFLTNRLAPHLTRITTKAAEAKVEQQQRTANSHLGVFGQQAVSEVKQVRSFLRRSNASRAAADRYRQLFWNGVEGAKGFAKRSTWWDMLFMGIRSIGRDQNLAEYVLEVIFRFLVNLFIGLFFNTVYRPLLSRTTAACSFHSP